MHNTSCQLDTIKYSAFYFSILILVENLVLSSDGKNINTAAWEYLCLFGCFKAYLHISITLLQITCKN